VAEDGIMALPAELPEHPYYMSSLAGDPSYNVPESPNPSRTGWWQNGSDDPGGMTFADFLDIINPLQHLPIISTIYRAITGDKIGLAAKLVGGTLYGGPIGFLAQGVTAAFEQGAGKTTGEMLAELVHDVFGPSDAPDEAVAASSPELPPSPVAVAAAPADEGARKAAIAWRATAAPAPLLPLAVERTALLPDRAAAAGVPSRPADDAASRRIAETVAAAQRAQMGLLLASLQGEPRTSPPRRAEKEDPAATPEVRQAPENRFLPQGVGPGGWTSESMAEALARYERVLRERRPAAVPLAGE
jgi:hypothetical protein